MAVDVLSGNELLQKMVQTFIDWVKDIPEVRYVALIPDAQPPRLVTILDTTARDLIPRK